MQTNSDAVLERLDPLLKSTGVDQRPVVLMMCGVAGSGKSTLANAVVQHFPNFQRLSIDGIIASRHGIYGIDYPITDYQKYQDEADTIFRESVEAILSTGKSNLVLDRSFYAKEDRDYFKEVIEQHGGRWVLVYLNVSKDVLWQRIRDRRAAGVNADSALEISQELLDVYVEGFEIPNGEGEVVAHN